MKRSFLLIFFILPLMLASQPPTIQWEKSFGGTNDDLFNSMCLTRDSNIALIGYTSSANAYIVNNHGSNDVWLMKIDLSGNLIWNNCYGGQSIEKGYNLKETNDSGFIIIADARVDDGQVSGVHWSTEYWVVKADKQGIFEWGKCFGGSGGDDGRSIIQTADSGYFIVGESESGDFDVPGGHLNGDLWVLKLYPDSNIQFSETFGGNGPDGAMGKESCIQTSDGSYLVVSNSNSTDGDVTGSHGGAEAWVTRISATGQLLWQRCYGGSGLENGFAILPAANNGFIVGGTADSNNGDVSNPIGGGDFWLFKADSSGVIQWEKCYGGGATEEIYSIVNTSDGGYALAGYSNGNGGQVSGVHSFWHDFWVAKIDSVGNFEWGKALGGTETDNAYAIVQLYDGSFIVAGSIKSNDGDVSQNSGGIDAWVVKLSPPGLNIKAPEYSIMDISIFQQGNSVISRFFSRVNEDVKMEIYNLAGQKIAEQKVRVNEGMNYFSMPGNYKAGSYCLKIGGGKFSQSKTFVIVN